LPLFTSAIDKTFVFIPHPLLSSIPDHFGDRFLKSLEITQFRADLPFQVGQIGVERGAIDSPAGKVLERSLLFQFGAAGPFLPESIGPVHHKRKTMEPADHGPIRIEKTAARDVQGTYIVFLPSQVRHSFRPLGNLPLPSCVEIGKALEKVKVFAQGVVEEVSAAAVILAARTVKTVKGHSLAVGLVHGFVDIT
jgi:hypothetical protein